MTIRNTYAAEAWDKVYSAFDQINFTSYDYDTVKESLLQYLKIYHSEHFNDFIESSELIAILELFAYVTELLAYRIDIMSHENFITTAQRKSSILRLAKLISYTSARNIPARGLVKITTVRTSESVFDSLGINLANQTIIWNDANNSNWKEQFFLVMNRVMTSRFGRPSKSFQINDVQMQLYTFNNLPTAFRNGVFAFSASGVGDPVQMEAVPADIDENGPYERAPDINAQFNIIYASDGKGDGSDYTGFLMFVKQGTLLRTDYSVAEPTANRRIELETININDTDVWVYRVDDTGTITEDWKRVETLYEQNLQFNDALSTRKKFEVETLENDRIALLFGDGNLSDAPVGDFQLWTRVSVNEDISIPKNKIVDQQMKFGYTDSVNNTQSFILSFSLTAAIQNNSSSETIEHIRQTAPSTYYAQNRMVNGQDYNTYMLKDTTILRLKTINRTFAGQPKYIEWNDASRSYQNVKLFGDDLTMFMDVGFDMQESTLSSRTIIDSVLEPILSTNAILNTLTHLLATSDDGYGIITFPRRKFIEDNRQIYRKTDGTLIGDGTLKEKTIIQGALDRHWYGEPLSYVTIGDTRYAVVSSSLEDDKKIYLPDIPRTQDGTTPLQPGDVGSGLQPVQSLPYFGLRFNKFFKAFGSGTISLLNPNDSRPLAQQPAYGLGDGAAGPAPCNGLQSASDRPEVFTIEMTSDLTTFTVFSNLRGKLPDYRLAISALDNPRWSAQVGGFTPIDFAISAGVNQFLAGDAFIVEIRYTGSTAGARVRKIGTAPHGVNLNGWWQLISASDLETAGLQSGPNKNQSLDFNPNDAINSWVFLVRRLENLAGDVIGWEIYNRNLKILVESLSTKFWYNQTAQIIDPETRKPVFDKIRILRSNLDAFGKPLRKADIYDVVGHVKDSDGIINYNQLEVLPTDTSTFSTSGDGLPDNLLQFEAFSANSYEFILVHATTGVIVRSLKCDEYEFYGYDDDPYDLIGYNSGIVSVKPGITGAGIYEFTSGNFISAIITAWPYRLIRRKKVPSPLMFGSTDCNLTSGLDFMWQHFSPVTNLIDPSASNIHDAFILTRGYYNSVIDYVRGLTSIEPSPPTPLELRTSYGYLLKNKMLSDTVVLHSGRIKLLFGALAEQQYRAKFKVVKSTNASFSEERIKTEILSVINTYFDVQNWDFGDKFYATELISLIHQRLTSQISSVVLVPTYSVNSFGSLFTIDSGFDEILQSAASLSDIEIVDELTPTVLRQTKS